MYWGDVPNANNDKGFCSQIYSGQFKVGSTFHGVETGDDINDQCAVSQDHIVTLLIGLSLINKYVDYSATDNGAVFPYEGQNVSSIKQEAWNIVDRFAQHFKNNPFYNFINPFTNNPVHPGGNTAFTQYGLAESMCKAEGVTTGPTSPFVPIFNSYGSLVPFTCNYATPYVKTFGLPSWDLYVTTASTSVDNAGFKCHLLATGNSGWIPGPVNVAQQVCDWVSNTICNWFPWPLNTICNIVNSFICNTIPTQVPGFRNEIAMLVDLTANGPYHIQDQIKENTPRRYDMWDAPLLYRVLFPNATTNYQSYLPPVKTMLDNAPCEGPYNFGQFARPNYEWTCESRIEKTINRQDFNEPNDGWYGHIDNLHKKSIFKGEYNGTDFMLYHNLYRLTSGVGASGYQDLSHRYINITLPVGSLCAKPNTCLFRAFETIVADNTINSNGTVEYKAGKIIDLKPGFYVSSGADFHAYIQAPNCNSGSAGLRTIQDTSKSDSNSFEGYDTMGDDILTHYVDYSQEKDSVREDLTKGILPSAIVETLTESGETKTLLINEDLNDHFFTIYPNPTDGIVNIEFSLDEGEIATLYIINNNGGTIAQNEMPKEKFHKLILNTSSLAKGLYLIRLVTSNNRVEKKTLTVQ